MTTTVEFPKLAERLKPELDALAPEIRRAIGLYLLETSEEVSPEEEAEAKAEWKKILARRVAEMESGKVKGVPAEEVFRQIREKHR